jgi:hypothetical protein
VPLLIYVVVVDVPVFPDQLFVVVLERFPV